MSATLQQLADDFANVVAQAGASTVRVDARRRIPATGIIWSADGVIVTSHHVVRREENIVVSLPDGENVPATLVGRDPTTDMAVLRVNASGLSAAEWVDFAADTVRVGQLVLLAGRPQAHMRAALGLISIFEEGWRTPHGGQIDHFFQVDGVMYPGFSGGPLLNAAGQLLGMNTSALLRQANLTLPAPTVRRVVESLLAHGKMKRGYLGVSTQTVRLPQNLTEELAQKTGLILVSVEPDSPAEQGGLLLGDTIISMDDDTPMRHHDDLLAMLNSSNGATVEIKLIRGGKIEQLTLVVGERA